MAPATQDKPIDCTSVAALVITYFPDHALSQRLDALLDQFARVALVDNGSSKESLEAITGQLKRPEVTMHRNPTNLGIATALNQGMGILADEGFKWVVTFDQDSEVWPGFVAAHLATLNDCQDRQVVALIGANRIDPSGNITHRWVRPHKIRLMFERVACEEAADGVTLVITSGTLTNVDVFKRLGGFREDLFIDLVDSEFCIRARQHGYDVLVSCAAKLKHKVGEITRHKVLGARLSSTNHSPLRRYYLFRNGALLINEYGRKQPHWLVYQILALCEVLLGIVLFEADKWRKLRALMMGLRDGLAGRSGPAAGGVS